MFTSNPLTQMGIKKSINTTSENSFFKLFKPLFQIENKIVTFKKINFTTYSIPEDIENIVTKSLVEQFFKLPPSIKPGT